MKNTKYTIFLASLLAVSLVFHTVPCKAETKFNLHPYLWATDTTGDITDEGVESATQVGIGDALNKGNGGLNLDWSVRGTDTGLSWISQFVYSPLSDTNPEIKSQVGAFDAAELEFTQFFVTEMIGINLAQGDESYFDLTLGGRMTNVDTRLKFRGGPEDRRRYDYSDTWVDPLVGFDTVLMLGEGVYFHSTADVGGFNANSSLTWQALAYLGFQLNSAASLSIGYKAISVDYENEDEAFLYDVVMHGPTLGFDFNF
jgi:hypothetical protein